MSNLYEITGNLRELQELMENECMPWEDIKDTMESVNGEWSEKVEATCTVYKNIKALVNEMKEEILSLQERVKAKEKRLTEIEQRLTDSMFTVGKDKFESAKHLIRFTKSTTVDIADSEKYCKWAIKEQPATVTMKVSYSPVKAEIKKLINSGVQIDGVTLSEHKNIHIK